MRRQQPPAGARSPGDTNVFNLVRMVPRATPAMRAPAIPKLDRQPDGQPSDQPSGQPAAGHTAAPAAAPPEAPSTNPRYKWTLLGVIGLAVLGFGSLMTLVNAALVPIADELDTTVPTAGWVMTGLMLAMAVSTPAGGKLADIYGHRRMFLLGLVGMTTTMIANAWVPDIGTFIGLRVIFGVSGGLLMPSGMALLMAAFGRAERARAVGWFQFAMTGAPTIGVVAGGPLLDIFGWREVFLVFGVISAVATLVAFAVVKPIARGVRVRIDVAGALLLAAATLGVLWAITRLATLSRTGISVTDDAPIQLALVGSLVALVLFIVWERRASSPLLDLRLFRRTTFSLPLIAAAANQFAYMGAFVIVPWVLQVPYGYSVGAAALLMVPRPGTFAIASPLGGSLVTSIGARIPMLIGSTAMICSMLAFAVGSDPGTIGLAWVFVGLVLSGVSAGVGSPAYQMLVANSVDDSDLGVANGMNQTVMWIGIVLGIQSMLAFAGDDPSVDRLRATFGVAAIVAAIGFIAPLLATSRRQARQPAPVGARK